MNRGTIFLGYGAFYNCSPVYRGAVRRTEGLNILLLEAAMIKFI
jgi:hypothetical protein